MTLRPATPDLEQQPRRSQPPPAPDEFNFKTPWTDAFLDLRDNPSALAVMWTQLAAASHNDFKLPPLAAMLLRSVAYAELRLEFYVDRAECRDAVTGWSFDFESDSDGLSHLIELAIIVDDVLDTKFYLSTFRRLQRVRMWGICNEPHVTSANIDLSNVFVFGNAARLTTLELDDVKVCCRQLAGLPSLTHLTICGPTMTDVTVLADSTSLVTLYFCECSGLTSGGTLGLERIPTLTELCFRDTIFIAYPRHLSASRSLRRLQPPEVDAFFPDHSCLSGMALASLTLIQAYDLTWLPTLSSLTELDLSLHRGLNVRHPEPIFQIEQLERLRLLGYLKCDAELDISTWKCLGLKQLETDNVDVIHAAAPLLTHLSALVQPDQLGAMNSWTTRGRSRLVDALYRAQRLTHLTLLCDHKLRSRPTECLQAVASCTLLRYLRLRLDHVIDLKHFGTTLVHLEELALSSRTLKGELAVLPSLSRFTWVCFGQDGDRGGVYEFPHGTADHETDEKGQRRYPSRPLVRGACDAVLESLAKQPSLTHIKLACSVQITSIAPLQHCPALRHLDVTKCKSLDADHRITTIARISTLNTLANRFMLPSLWRRPVSLQY